ncbi:MAG: pilus assembly protein [Rhodobacteraceae bacterium]|nr:pilus assembly protein [Paracoccaceae bacterium]
MTRTVYTYLRRFRRDERGQATVEFIFYFSFVILILGASIEVGVVNLRNAMMDRGLDLTVREIQLGTGAPPTYEEIKIAVCERAAIIPQCQANLRLELVETSARNFTRIPENADCQNAEEEVRPLRNFVYGKDNALMLIRACLKYKPIFPAFAVGELIGKDDYGYAKLVATSAFVQEPI